MPLRWLCFLLVAEGIYHKELKDHKEGKRWSFLIVTRSLIGRGTPKWTNSEKQRNTWGQLHYSHARAWSEHCLPQFFVFFVFFVVIPSSCSVQ